jgi:hypothetical protein
MILRAILIALSLGIATDRATAQPPMRGPLPAEQRQHIHQMAAAHEKIVREVELTDTGYVARTTSDDPQIVAMLHAHVAYMQKRLASGAMVRRWDPAFVEMVEHHSDIDATITELDDGLEVEVTAATFDAIAVAHNHARIVSGFVQEGMPAVQRTHPRALMKAGSD